MTLPASFFDANRLLRLRQIIRELDPDLPPRAYFIVGADRPVPRRLAVLPGSFNPPTRAHLALADSALATGTADRVDFLIASRTVNKERIEGASLADRLLMLEELAAARPDLGVILVNRGLYVDQAEIIRAALPGLEGLAFVVGFDKIVQIFDPRYYHHRDEALDRLFGLARFFVAPRGTSDLADLTALLDRPENRKYADGITPLDLAPGYRQMASSHLRLHDRAAIADLPQLAADFVRETGAYGRVDAASADEAAYRRRERALDLAESGQLVLATPTDFHRAIGEVPTGELEDALLPRNDDAPTSPQSGNAQ
jgi:nicotinic acid mononucleotide adenylyltransferase